MRKYTRFFIVLFALSVMMCMTALAADDVFVNKADGASFTMADSEDQFTVQYDPDTNLNGQYLILMVSADSNGAYTITESSIQYVDQKANAADGSITFNIYPAKMVKSQILLAGGNAEGPVVLGEYVPAGVTVSGQVKSYDPKKETTVKLMQDGVEKYTTTIAAGTTGSGQVTQAFSFSAVAPGTYDLVVSKAGHLDYTITGVEVGSEALDLTQNSDAAISTITLLAGDVNSDDSINESDVLVIRLSGNINKDVDAAENKNADVNGDGSVNESDVLIVRLTQHINKDTSDCFFNYQ